MAPGQAPRSLLEYRAFRVLVTSLAALSVLALLYVAWLVLDRFASILTLLLFALLVAFALGPAVAALERRGIPRVPAVLGIYVLLFGAIALAVAFAVVPLTAQLTSLGGAIPRYSADLNRTLQQADSTLARHHLPFRVAALQQQASGGLQAAAKALLGNAVGILTALASFVVDVVLMLVLSIYLLIDARRIHHNLVRIVPARHRDRAFFVEAAVVRVVGGYIRGQLLMAVLIGVLAGGGALALGVNYPLVIGVLAGLCELMPMIGPVLGAVPAVGIAFFQSPGLALWMVVYFVVIQQLEANVIGPRITGHAVGLHPIGAMLALLVGVELDGLVGALVGVPAAGILYVLGLAIYWEWTGRGVPAVQRRPPLALARTLIRRGVPAATVAARQAPAAPPTGGAALAEALADVGGDAAPPPQALAGLLVEAAALREHFERDEAERVAEQADAQVPHPAQEGQGAAPPTDAPGKVA